MSKKDKRTKKFASSGKLKQTIDSRRKYKQIKKKTEVREAGKARKQKRGTERHADDATDEEGEEDDEEVEAEGSDSGAERKAKGKGKATASSLLPEPAADEEDEEDEDDDLEDLEDDEEDELSDLEADAAAMAKSLSELQQKDPEFYKYLQENDADLLDFGDEEVAAPSKKKTKGKQAETGKAGKGKVAAVEAEDEDMEEYDAGSDDEVEPDFEGGDEEVQEIQKISVTMNMLRGWQRAMIEQRSLRSLRKTLLAFRAAVHTNMEDSPDDIQSKFSVDSPLVFNKLVLTALKFTPVVLAKHIPFKTNAQGRFKVAAPPANQANLPRVVLSHFNNVLHFIKSLPSTASAGEGEEALSLLETAISESTKLLPWVMNGKKQVKAYLKVLLDLWSSAGDSVRVACFLAVRKVYVAGDESIKDLCLKNIYSALLPPLRLTSAHTLPSLNLMKNSAAALYQLDPNLSYQHAFGYIRMLAVHLRSVVRGGQGDQDAFRAVYNWQFVHCIDFWSRVLAEACDREKTIENGGLASPLEPLIYPLVQIALGAIRLVPTSRFFPLRFHVLHSLLRIISKTGFYIPLAPYCLEVLESAEFKRSKPKASSLKPLDFEYIIRAPAAYPKTRIFQEGLAEELVFIMGEFHSLMGRHIAFPEMTIPVVAALRRHLKRAGGPSKANGQIKTLVEKIEATRTWVEKKRQNVDFAPNNRTEVDSFLDGTAVDITPIGTWMRLQRKVRDQKRKEIEMAQRQEQPASAGRDESDDEEDVEMDE